jgi:hypothetical protein
MTSTEQPYQEAQNYVDHVCYRMSQLELKSCRLSHPGLSDSHAQQVASKLTPHLRKLDVVNCPNLGADGVAVLCRALKQSQVTHFSLERVPIGDEGLQAITQLLESDGCTLKSLNLEENGPNIELSTWNQFLALACRKVQSLDLSRNSFTTDHLTELANGIQKKDNTLKALILSDNPIGDTGMERLCRAIHHNRSLMLLALGDCEITDRGIHALVQCLRHNCSLQRLYIYGNHVDLGSADNKEVRHWLELNDRGRRAFLRSENCRSEFLPLILAKESDNPEILNGLLRELPHIWAPNE